MRLGARGFGIAALGWLGVALSGTLFVVVDALVSAVLPALAAQGDSAYLGFRRLFDVLFVIGTWLAGLATLLVLLAPGGIELPVARPLRVFGAAASLVGIVSGVLFFCGFDTALGLGLSVGGASLTFTWLAARLYAEPAAQLAPASGVALASQQTLAG